MFCVMTIQVICTCQFQKALYGQAQALLTIENDLLGKDHRRWSTMSERHELLESIAQTTSDYRLGEIEAISSEHVDKWIKQFSGDVQLPLLRELDHVLKQTYFSNKRVVDFLEGLVTTNKLAGSDPCTFWKRANFLNIQQNGDSQKELLTIFDGVLEAKYGFKTAKCGATGGDFIYLDDAIFSGSRVINDIAAWIASDAPAQAKIHVVVLALHMGGYHWADINLKKQIDSSGKMIEIKYWRAKQIENRKYFKKNSEVLWPAVLPDNPELNAYLGMPHRYPFEVRPDGGNLGPFSSEEGRQLLERELLSQVLGSGPPVKIQGKSCAHSASAGLV